MDKIEKIKAEIERRLNILTNVYAEQVERKDEEMMNYYHGKVIALEELRPFIATLDEQPSEDLEVVNDLTEGPIKAVRLPDGRYVTEKLAREAGDLVKEVQRYYFDNFYYITSDQPTLSILTNIARHFYELGRQEKPKTSGDLEEEIARMWAKTCHLNEKKDQRIATLDSIEFENIARHFAEWQKEQDSLHIPESCKEKAESFTNEDLEAAADEMAIRSFPEKKSYSTVYDRNVDYNAVDRKNYRDGIIAGAKWQKEHDAELIEIAYNDGITIGMAKQKEQMLRDAVNGEVVKTLGGSLRVSSYIFKRDGFEFGDKVKLIIVKED